MRDPAQEEVNLVKASDSKRKPTFGYLLVFLFGIVLGGGLVFFISSNIVSREKFNEDLEISQPRELTYSSCPVTEEDLGIGLKILTNPLVGQWKGFAYGTVISKSDNGIVLRDERGNTFSLTNKDPGGETFNTAIIDEEGNETSFKETGFKKVEVGKYVSVQFFIFPKDKNRPVMGLIAIRENKKNKL